MTTENGAAIFDKVADIIAAMSDIPRDKIRPDSHAINDLGIDSLDFLDIAFAIDNAFGIRLPLEQWTQEVNDGKATTEQYFVLNNLCASIDGLVAATGLVDLPHPACMGLSLSMGGSRHFCLPLSFHSFVRPAPRAFFRPDRIFPSPSRAASVKDGASSAPPKACP
jgi:acyl carrier protein